MQQKLLMILGLVGFSLAAVHQIAKFVNDVWIRDVERKQLKARFETWWLTVVDLDSKAYSRTVAKLAEEKINLFLGPRLFSAKAALRCFIVSNCLLCCTAALLISTKAESTVLAPWEGFDESMKFMSDIASKQVTEKDAEISQFGSKVQKVAKDFNSPTWKVVHSVCFFVCLFLVNGLAGFSSMIFARAVLRELSLGVGTLSMIALVFFNFVMLALVAAAGFVIIGALASPFLIFYVYLLIKLAMLSNFWGATLGIVSFVVSWAVAGPAIKILVSVIFWPLIIVVWMCSLTAFISVFRRFFRWLVCRVILLCAEKDPILIIAGILGFLSAITASGITLLQK